MRDEVILHLHDPDYRLDMFTLADNARTSAGSVVVMHINRGDDYDLVRVGPHGRIGDIMCSGECGCP